MIPGARLKPWEHQEQAYQWALERPGSLIAADMGCGKSAVVVWLTAGLGLRRVLITCPLSVVGVWPKQFTLHAAQPCRVVTLDSSQTIAKRQKVAAAEYDREWGMPLVIVINHEAVWRKPFGTWALERPWDLIVADESHRMKQPGGKFSLYMNRLRPMAKRRLGLTGTPMPHSPLDVYAQCRFIDPSVFGLSNTRFKARYAVMGGYQNHQVVAYQNEDEMARKLDSVMFRVSAADVLDLPETQDITIPITLSAPEMRAYRDLSRELITQIEAGEVTVSNALVKLLRLQTVCCGHLKTDGGIVEQIGATKRQALEDLVEGISGAEPVVVFARFTADLDAIREVAHKLGRCYGELSGRARDALESDSTLRKGVQVAGVQIQSGGVGIDFTRAHYCVYYSQTWSLGEYLQSRARVHRPGQERPVVYYHLVASGTVESDLYAAHAAKEDAIQRVFAAIKERGAR